MLIRYKRGIAAISILLLLGMLVEWFTRIPDPDIEWLKKYPSPDGKWIAQVELVVYGGRWLTTDAAYQVHIVSADRTEDDSLVYSLQASGHSELCVRWKTNANLIVEDSSRAMRAAFKRPHASLQVQYCANDDDSDENVAACN